MTRAKPADLQTDEAPSGAPLIDQAVDAVEEEAAFPVVGIGASAGGLAAFEAFFSAMPAETETGMAFVLVQHLAPDHKSFLSELVKRYARMEVFEVEDGMQVRPNSAYIIPPNRDMALLNGSLQLFEPVARRGQRLPIDFFFCSLAQAQRDRAVCIVLSGSGADGTLGVRAIKEAGGMVMAQNPESTEYDGMPRSAIGTGLVDFVLPPAEMPAQLIAFASQAPSGLRRASAVPPAPAAEDALKEIFGLLRVQTGHDFSQYKQATINRRVERRMAVQEIDQMDAYVRYLQETPAEIEALFRDLLIGVTRFFRDPPAYQALEAQIIPRLAAGTPADGVLRAWVPGCSTGEEAYSIAMLVREARDALKLSFDIQVFATDIDARALDAARAGVYLPSIVVDLSAQRLAQHFLRLESGNYRVQKNIRDLVIFSEQDVIKDPPFSRLDLISCRNMLIYMGPELQQKLMPLFHYALKPEGVLFLGTSETIGEFGNLFSTTDRTAKLYQRKDDVFGTTYPRLWKARSSSTPRGTSAPLRRGVSVKAPLRDLTESALLEDGPAAALVNGQGELLYVHGHTGRYLEPAPGDAGLNILKMAREGLRHYLTSALYEAVSGKHPVVRRALRVGANGDFAFVDLAVRPMAADPRSPGAPALFLVVFTSVAPPEVVNPVAAVSNVVDGGDPEAGNDDARVRALEQELRAKDDHLRATQLEMQTANDELQYSNEELQSINEESQSTNEELETSKEELQSVNEELATVNAELQSKVLDLSRINNDMNNLLAATGIGTIFVDQLVHIQRFTPAAVQFVHLIPTDVGRPLAHIASKLLGYDSLVADVQSVLDTLVPKEVEVQGRTGGWYLLRIRPYRTSENVVEGAVVTFTEATVLKKAQAVLREWEALRIRAGAVRDAADAITVQDLEGRILAWNPGAVSMYGWTEAEALLMNVHELIPEGRRKEELGRVERLGRAEVLEPSRAQRLAKDGRVVEVTLTATALVSDKAGVYALTTTERGIAS